MPSLKRTAAIASAVVGLGGALFGVSALVAPPRETPVAAAPAPVFAGSDAAMSALQARLRRLPDDWSAWSALGHAYSLKATTTADPTWYTKADDAFTRSLELRPNDNDGALTGQAALASSRHDFAEALVLARRAQRINPYGAPARGALVDALVELGRYEDAERQLQRMLDLRPSVASFSRASYFRELHGDISGARQALEQAQAFASTETDKLFVRRYLGRLAFSQGDVKTALREYEEGLRLVPDDPALLAARAEARAATGQVDAALEDYGRSVARLPDPVHIADYAAVLQAAGRIDEARQQRDVARAAFRLLQDGGAAIDLDLALHEARLGNGEAAVAAARREYSRRITVHTEDALAYALHVAGRDTEALPHAVAAERLSRRDGLFAYHRGLVEARLRMPQARATLARAVRINPHSRDGRAAAAVLARLRTRAAR